MTLRIGSNGLMVSAWSRMMLKRYPSYATGRNGDPLLVDGYFGYDEQKVQQEYQRRTGQGPDGEVSESDLHKLGLKPTLISIHGTGQPDPFGIGYPADIARALLDVYHWQPLGNYPAQAIPMNHSVDQGEREGFRLISDRNITPGPVAFVDYSQGSIIGGRLRNRMRSGDLRDRYLDLIGAASFGNPMRPVGSFAGSNDPGGSGIDPKLETASERFCLNLAERGDLYTTCPTDKTGEMERSIFNMVFSKFTGRDSIIEQIGELVAEPLRGVPAAAKAIINAGMFFGNGTGPHVQYHIRECAGTGTTYYEYAIKHLRDLAESRLQRIAAG